MKFIKGSNSIEGNVVTFRKRIAQNLGGDFPEKDGGMDMSITNCDGAMWDSALKACMCARLSVMMTNDAATASATPSPSSLPPAAAGRTR